ncbi:MAG TPA: DUF4328 domain-containing protein [Pseudonocardiaceae bacterium]|nr:DUF4328 domain-containing protein [Pseudonocardiaceae bacterium]
MTYLGPYPDQGGPHHVTWVAGPPTGAPPVRAQQRRPGYGGPPAYPAVPRWGFPRLGWREPTSVPGTSARPPGTADRMVRHAHSAVSVLWMVAISALLAGGGEIWRYVLLLLGRTQALPGDVVAISDALVNTGAALAVITGLIALVLVPRWLLCAREVAATLAGDRPARPDWQVLLGVLLPGLNLFVAGSALTELEHTALGLTTEDRMRPSRLVLAWWLVWAGGETLALVTVGLGLRTSVSAHANGVLWYAATDLVAVAVAVLTVRVLGSITGLLAPGTVRTPHRQLTVRVTGAPPPPLRPQRPSGSVR